MQNYFPNIIIPVLISAAVSITTTIFILSSTEEQFETQMKINSVNNKINELRIVSDEMRNLKLSEEATAITNENCISIYKTFRQHMVSIGSIVLRNKHL